MILRRCFRLSLKRSRRCPLALGEAIVTNSDDLAVFDLIRHKRHGDVAMLVAFDLIELDGADLRRSAIEYRKQKLTKLVRNPRLGIVLNEHYEGDGEVVFQHACKLGCEGIVSKRLGSPYRSGRSPALGENEEPGSASGQAGGGLVGITLRGNETGLSQI